MPFTKGHSGNPQGRGKGTPNKSTAAFREMVQDIIIYNFNKNKIAKDLQTLTPKARLDFYIKLLEYTVPKPTEDVSVVDHTQSTFFQTLYNGLKKANNNLTEN